MNRRARLGFSFRSHYRCGGMRSIESLKYNISTNRTYFSLECRKCGSIQKGSFNIYFKIKYDTPMVVKS